MCHWSCDMMHMMSQFLWSCDMRQIIFSVDVTVGFEQNGDYNVSEADGRKRVCAVVSNPPIDQPLLFDASLIATGIPITAGKMYSSLICNHL